MKQEYLNEMLRDNKSVIIPGIGAFVNNDSKQMPLLFNEYLKFNDGALASFISRKENISIDDAGRKIEVFVDGLKSLLDSGRDVVLPGMGKLNKSSDGKIIFTYIAGNELEKEKELQEQEQEKKKEKELQEQRQEQEQEKKKEKELQEQRQEHEKKKEKELQEQRQEQENKKEKELQEQRQEQEKKKEKELQEKQKEKVKPAPVVLSEEEKLRRKKKKKRVILVVVLLILLGGGGTGGYLYKDQILGLFGGTAVTAENKTEEPAKKTTETTEINPEDTLATEKTPSTESVLTSEEVPVEVAPEPEVTKTVSHPQTSASSGTFYVIVGCYSDATNADRMIEKANAKGLQGENLGSYGGLQHVSVYSSSDLSDAAAKAMQIRSDFPNAWVFGKK